MQLKIEAAEQNEDYSQHLQSEIVRIVEERCFSKDILS